MYQAHPHLPADFRVYTLEARVLLCSIVHTPPGTIAEAPAPGRIAHAISAPLGGSAANISSSGMRVPVLHSYSAAAAKIYLDFTGSEAADWGDLRASATPAFDRDGDVRTFSSSEIDAMREIWSRLAEKFSPFRIDVTTEDPGNLADGKTLKIVFGGDGAWYGCRVGGLSFVGSFIDSSPNVVYVFTQNMNDGDPKLTAEAAAHEIGHAFGLDHQAQWDGQTLISDYNTGDGDRAPIMGVSYHAARGLWWRGLTPAGTVQDDIAVMAQPANGFGLRPDDHADVASRATRLNLASPGLSGGVIENSGDVDLFRFTAGSGALELRANPAEFGPMLDLKMELRDSAGNVIASADTGSLGESISATVSAGGYVLAISSHGGYGDIGQYTITGEIPAPPRQSAQSTVAIAAPRKVSARIWSRTRVRLAWADIWKGEDRLLIEQSIDRQHWRKAATARPNSRAVLLGRLRPGTRYFFRIRAEVGGQLSPYSRPVSVRI